MALKCIIVDDEEMATKVIETHLTYFKDIEIVGTYQNAMEAFSVLQTQKIDLMFLDIQMPQMSGISLLKSLSKSPYTIFTTAYREFALDSYELNAVDYLLKPIAFERFAKAIGKVLHLSQIDMPPLPLPSVSETPELPFIYIKSDRQMIKILLDDICFIESMKNHLKIITEKNTFTTLFTISEMEEKLPPQRFLRIHRSFIVAIGKIQQFSYAELTVAKQSLPIGNVYKNEVLKRLGL